MFPFLVLISIKKAIVCFYFACVCFFSPHSVNRMNQKSKNVRSTIIVLSVPWTCGRGKSNQQWMKLQTNECRFVQRKKKYILFSCISCHDKHVIFVAQIWYCMQAAAAFFTPPCCFFICCSLTLYALVN